MDGFAESTKRKAAVWPLQIILLILCPEIIQDISKDVVDENNMNKVRREKLFPLMFRCEMIFLKNFSFGRAVRRWRCCRILVSQLGIEPGPWQWKCQVLTTRWPGNSHEAIYFTQGIYFFKLSILSISSCIIVGVFFLLALAETYLDLNLVGGKIGY